LEAGVREFAQISARYLRPESDLEYLSEVLSDRIPPLDRAARVSGTLWERQIRLNRCRFSIDTDAHAPAQLEWQYIGCDSAAECGVTEGHVINTNPAAMLLSWIASRRWALRPAKYMSGASKALPTGRSCPRHIGCDDIVEGMSTS
jgi:hypothetical protein